MSNEKIRKKRETQRERTLKLLNEIHEEALDRAKKYREHGRRCCANQLLLLANYIENKIKSF